MRLGEALEDREERGAEGLREGAQERRLAAACADGGEGGCWLSELWSCSD